MNYFLQQLINGISLGAVYGLIAIGYTMVYGIIGIINFAHGDIYMVGAFVSLTGFLLMAALGISYVPAAIALVLIVDGAWGLNATEMAGGFGGLGEEPPPQPAIIMTRATTAIR